VTVVGSLPRVNLATTRDPQLLTISLSVSSRSHSGRREGERSRSASSLPHSSLPRPRRPSGTPPWITDAPPSSFPKLTFLWEYRDAEGRLIGYVDRVDRAGGKKDSFPKTFCRNEETGGDGVAAAGDATASRALEYYCVTKRSEPCGSRVCKQETWTPISAKRQKGFAGLAG
jgi:hypothetical protein